MSKSGVLIFQLELKENLKVRDIFLFFINSSQKLLYSELLLMASIRISFNLFFSESTEIENSSNCEAICFVE